MRTFFKDVRGNPWKWRWRAICIFLFLTYTSITLYRIRSFSPRKLSDGLIWFLLPPGPYLHIHIFLLFFPPFLSFFFFPFFFPSTFRYVPGISTSGYHISSARKKERILRTDQYGFLTSLHWFDFRFSIFDFPGSTSHPMRPLPPSSHHHRHRHHIYIFSISFPSHALAHTCTYRTPPPPPPPNPKTTDPVHAFIIPTPPHTATLR